MLYRLLFILILFSPLSLRAQESLQVFVSTAPGTVTTGDSVTIFLLVQNNGLAQANNVLPSLVTVDPYAGASGRVTWLSGPDPVGPVFLASAAMKSFTYVYQSSSCGDAAFSASASGTEQGSGTALTAADQVASVSILCPTPTLTPTPWIIYETPTPGPAEASAAVRGNVFRLGGIPVQLDFSVTVETDVSIRIFNRNGRVIRTIKRRAAPGTYTESWDGRDDTGGLASTGIYIVHFQAKGLNQRAKIAFIK